VSEKLGDSAENRKRNYVRTETDSRRTECR